MPSYTLPYTGVLDVPANTMLGNNTGSAAAAIGLTQAQTLTFLGDPGGAFGADAATQITPSTAIVLDEATGNEIGLDISYVVNKATSGNDTGLLISMTDTASPGTSLPLDIQVGGSSVMSVDAAGNQTLTHAGVGDFPSLSLYKYSSGSGHEPKLKFYKSANNTVGGNTTLSTSHDQGSIEFWGNDGNGHHESAKIYSKSGGTSNNVVPGDLRFATNAGGTESTDRVVIGSAGETTFSYPVIVTAPAATDIPLSITGAAAQSANLFDITSNGGTAGDLLSVDSAGDATFSGELTLSSPTVPASAAATGVAGTVSWAAGYVYICTATDTWKRVAIATW